jgi:hypothetical protein
MQQEEAQQERPRVVAVLTLAQHREGAWLTGLVARLAARHGLSAYAHTHARAGSTPQHTHIPSVFPLNTT